MASFSVNRDKIVFASQRTGSVTLLFDNFPLGGYRRSISGESSYFTLSTVNTDSQATLTTRAVNNDTHSHRMVVKYTNASDSSDYIEIEVIQRGTRYPQIGGVDYPDIADSEGCWGKVLYVPASEMGGTEVLVDSSTGCSFQIVSDEQNWLNCVDAYPHITDTGFLAYNVTYIRNYDRQARRGTVSFIDANSNTVDLLVYQEGNTPSQNTVSGYRRVIGDCLSKSADIRIDYPSGANVPDKYEIINPDGSGQYYDWVTVYKSSYSTYVTAEVSAGTSTLSNWNLSPYSRAIIVEFRTTTNANSYVTSVLIVQKGWPDWFEVRPDSICTNKQGTGSYGVAVFSDSSVTGAVTSGSDWLSNLNITSASKGGNTYYYMTVAIASNSTGVDRTGEIQVTDGTDTIAVPVTQSSLLKGAIPSELFFDNEGGDKELEVVTNSNILLANVSAHSYPSWLSETVSYFDYDRASLIYTAESNSSSTRTGNIVFADTSGNQVSVPVTQGEYVLSVSPSYLSFTSAAGGRLVDVTYASNLSTNASSMPAWVSESYVDLDAHHREYDIRVSQNNTGSSRSFSWVLTDSTDSIAVPVTQAAGTPPVQNITVSPSSLIYTYGSDSQDVTLNYISGSYTYSISDGGSSWITINSTAVSSGVDTLSISVSQNTGSQRSATVTITSSAGYGSCTVSIIQQEKFYISPSEDIYNAYGRSASGDYTSLFNNVNPVSVSTSDSWVSASVSGDRVYVTVAENITSGVDSERTGSVVITDALGTSATYGITQAGDDIMFNPNPVVFDADGSGGPEVLYVYCHSGAYTEDKAHPDSSTVPSWLSFSSIVGGINGILDYNITASENTSSSPRSAVVTFTEMSGAYTGHLYITQAAGEGEELSVSPSELNFSASGGTSSVTVSGGTGTIAVNTGSFPSWLSITSVGGGVYNITAAENSGTLRSFGVWFTDEAFNTVIVDVYQQASSVVLTVSPSSKSFGSAGGSQVFRVTYNTRINYNTLPSWLSVTSSTVSASSIEYTMTAAENTGSSRSFSWVLSDAVNSVTVPILQSGTGPGPGGDVVVSPDRLVFGPDGGSSSVTVTYTGSLSINTDSFPGWLSMVSSGDTYTFSVAENIGTESRSFGVIFRSGGDTAVLNILQGGRYASFSVTPERLEFGADAESKTVYFGFVPSGGLGYQVKSGTGGWLSVSMNTPVATVSVTNNYGTSGSHPRRSSSIKFYNLSDPDDYVVVLVEQEGANAVYSMWNDYFFNPDDVTEGDDFHFLISIDGGIINDDFYGLSPYIEGTGRGMESAGIVPLNISRYLNKCIEGNRYILFDDSYYTPYVWNPLWGEVYVDIKHLDENGDIINIYPQIWFWNDWSYKVKCYDYNRTLNDPINNKGCSGMYVPFCVYTEVLDTSTSYSVTKTDEIGEQVTNVLGNPHPFAGVDFAINCDRYYNAQKVDFKRGSEVVLSYDMTHCGDGYLLYRNRFGGWDSFLIEGNIKKKDSFTRSYMSRNIAYDACLYDVETVDTNVKTSYELSTGWLSDDESERLVYHLLSSPTIYFHSFKDDSTIKVNIVDSSSEYKKFKNGRNLVSYVITVEDTLTRQVNI